MTGERSWGSRPAGTGLADLRRLLAEEPGDPEAVAEARRRKEAALLDFGVGESAVASWLYAKCHHHIPTAAIPTAAVVATGDGGCALLYNPSFFLDLDPDGVKFVLFHEARHLMHRHLHVDEELRRDPVFSLAAEVSINHVALRRLNRTSLPTVPVRRDGDERGKAVREPVGVDPDEVYRSYRDDLDEQGLPPLPYEEFIHTDLTVYGELRRMKSLSGEAATGYCVHLTGDPADGGSGAVPLDPETVERLGGEVLGEVMRAALRGGPQARSELLDLAGRTLDGGERLERMWGLLGLDKLRGSTPRTRRVDWWQRWLTDVLASKLEESERLVYPKKHGAVLLALGHDPMLARRGPERKKVVLIAFDTSGSMPDSVVEWLTMLVGQTDGVESHWLAFDGVVTPFVPGERVVGGGGTDFQNVVDYAEGRLEIDGKALDAEPDAIIMVTDGYAPPVAPADPGRWIWLITDGGDDWPDRHRPPMACHRVAPGR
ncbi:DUF2201 family putative metallopeptidase [Actinomadura verrucosospora]|uniref:Putative metallopeptidase domain-containing protein n=1 Tax=Actinomadura verrucosospora TaxID=46165 RepID=A0A7D3VSQ8_ACTVE|nr:hypothetical protein [Actinomadura verrucosospora]QKG21599.1 hypothetical protein ACTIVE_3237 [Actinomadura verrucosospora]